MTSRAPASSRAAAAPPRSRASRFLPWLLVFAALLALAIWVDLPLARLLQRETPAQVDDFFEHVGDLANTDLFAVLALLVYGIGLWRLRRKGGGEFLGVACERWVRGSLLVIATMLVGGLVTLLLKHVVARARPEAFFEDGFYGLGSPFSGDPFTSFPSSHTLTAFAVAAALARLAPVLRWPLFLLAAAVGLSRLVNLDHYLTDVVAAAVVAVIAVQWLAPAVLDPQRAWALRAPWQWGRAQR